MPKGKLITFVRNPAPDNYTETRMSSKVPCRMKIWSAQWKPLPPGVSFRG